MVANYKALKYNYIIIPNHQMVLISTARDDQLFHLPSSFHGKWIKGSILALFSEFNVLYHDIEN